MDELLFHTLVAHIDCLQNPHTDNLVRRQSTQWLEEFKARDDCVEYVNFILTSNDETGSE